MIIAIRDAMKHLDTHRVEAVQRWDLDSVAEDFFLNELRVTMDDLAVASLTELCDHLFFLWNHRGSLARAICHAAKSFL